MIAALGQLAVREVSVLCGLPDVVDCHDGYRSTARFELQAELLLQRGKDRRTVGHNSVFAFRNTSTIIVAVSLPVLVFWRLG